MKKWILIAAASMMAVVLLAASGTNQSTTKTVGDDTTVNVTFLEPGYITVYVSGTNTAWVSFGGYSVSSSADPLTYYLNRFPVQAGGAYTTREKHTLVSVYAVTETTVVVTKE